MSYNYQKPLINKVLDHLYKKENVVLAACPGAGKTVMAIRVIDKYLKQYPKAKILILTHGQTVLRSQWMERLTFFRDQPDFMECTANAIDSPNINIYVAIPQSYRMILKYLKRVDMVIVDEAHHFYRGSQVNQLLKKLKPRSELLLTGTPSAYLDNPHWKVVGITLQELLMCNVIADPQIELLESKYDISISDYTRDDDLKVNFTIRKDYTEETLESVINKLKSNKGSLAKTMIACSSQIQARIIYESLILKGYRSLLSISDQKTGNDLENLDLFKTDMSYTFLVVVQRGVLGFDFEKLVNVVDFTSSLNVNRIFQLLCRIVRKDRANPHGLKRYLKISAKQIHPLTYYIMSFVVSLSDERYYYSYKGKPELQSLNIPIKTQFIKTVQKDSNICIENVPHLLTFKELNEIDSTLKTTSYTNFATVKQMLNGKVSELDLISIYELLKGFKSRAAFTKAHPKEARWIDYNRRDIYDAQFGKYIAPPLWTFKTAIKAAKRYKTREQFKKNESGAYNYLNQRYKEELHKVIPRSLISKWTLELALKELARAKTRNGLRKGAYEYFRSTGQMELVNRKFPIRAFPDTKMESKIRKPSK